MKKHLILIIVLCFAATLQLKAQKEYTVSSPNGTLELKIITEDTLSYQLFSGGEAISEISPSSISLFSIISEMLLPASSQR